MPLKTLVTLLRVVEQQGYPVESALEHIGLEFNPLTEDASRLPRQVPTECYSRLYALLMEILQDEAFGLGQENHAPPGTFRMLCLFIIHCPTLEQALIRAREFHDYCDQFRQPADTGQDRGAPLLDLEDDRVLCRFERSASTLEDRAYIGHANVLLMMHRFYSWLIGRQLPLDEVHLRASGPEDARAYENVFDCPVRFDMPHSGLVLKRDVLAHPVVQTEDSLREFLRQAPYPLVHRETPGTLKPLSHRIERLLAEYTSERLPTASEVARRLAMSPRTLHRKLTREDTSFQQLKDDYRRELAVHYIHRPELSIDAIAAVMGFQDNSAFYRSFKKWTGQSPGQYRACLQREAQSL
jgi:AraC-like DNA-binding protein